MLQDNVANVVREAVGAEDTDIVRIMFGGESVAGFSFTDLQLGEDGVLNVQVMGTLP